MDTYYTTGYETSWYCQAVGRSQTSRHSSAASKRNVPGRDRHRKGIFELCGALVSSLPQGEAKGVACSSDPWATPALVEEAERAVKAIAIAGSDASWLLHRLVDPEANCEAGRATLWGSLLHRGSMEAAARGTEMELAKAGTTGDPEGPKGHRTLEEAELAPYKKKPEDLRPIWLSSTRADSCSSPTSVRPGHRWEEHPSCTTVIGGIGSPPSPASRSPQGINGWDSMCNSTGSTSRACRLSGFCATSCTIFEDRWSCSGMVDPSTSAKWSATLFTSKPGSTSIPFLPMPRSSTPMNLSGPRPNIPCPTALLKTPRNSSDTFVPQSKESGDRRNCCGLVSSHLICHGPNNMYVSII